MTHKSDISQPYRQYVDFSTPDPPNIAPIASEIDNSFTVSTSFFPSNDANQQRTDKLPLRQWLYLIIGAILIVILGIFELIISFMKQHKINDVFNTRNATNGTHACCHCVFQAINQSSNHINFEYSVCNREFSNDQISNMCPALINVTFPLNLHTDSQFLIWNVNKHYSNYGGTAVAFSMIVLCAYLRYYGYCPKRCKRCCNAIVNRICRRTLNRSANANDNDQTMESLTGDRIIYRPMNRLRYSMIERNNASRMYLLYCIVSEILLYCAIKIFQYSKNEKYPHCFVSSIAGVSSHLLEVCLYAPVVYLLLTLFFAIWNLCRKKSCCKYIGCGSRCKELYAALFDGLLVLGIVICFLASLILTVILCIVAINSDFGYNNSYSMVTLAIACLLWIISWCNPIMWAVCKSVCTSVCEIGSLASDVEQLELDPQPPFLEAQI